MADEAAKLKDIFIATVQKLAEKKRAAAIDDEALVGKLDMKAAESLANVAGQIQRALDNVQGSIDKLHADPVSGGGCVAGCATWYAQRTAKKLGKVKTDCVAIRNMFGEMHHDTTTLDGVRTAVPALTACVADVLALPDTLTGIMGKLDSSLESIGDVDLAPAEKLLNGNTIHYCLQRMSGSANQFTQLSDDGSAALRKLRAFTDLVPSTIRNAFKPVGCVPIVVTEPSVENVAAALAHVEQLAQLQEVFSACIAPFGPASEAIKELDRQAHGPLKDYLAEAAESTAALVSALSHAKQAAAVVSADKDDEKAVREVVITEEGKHFVEWLRHHDSKAWGELTWAQKRTLITDLRTIGIHNAEWDKGEHRVKTKETKDIPQQDSGDLADKAPMTATRSQSSPDGGKDPRDDFGPSLIPKRCAKCKSVTLNRGDKDTKTIYCLTCFNARG